MKKSAVIFLKLSISMPIWYYLLYQILVRVQATDVMFLLFWVYVPVGILIAILVEIFEGESK